MKKIKILMSLLIILSLIFVQTTLTYSSAVSPKDIVNRVFNERINLARNVNISKLLLSEKNEFSLLNKYFTSKKTEQKCFKDFLNNVYGPMEGFGQFDVVDVLPFYKIYKIDKKDSIAAAYVEEILIFKLKEHNPGKIIRKVPESWIVPNTNGVWESAVDSYYTIVLKKTSNSWKIVQFENSGNSTVNNREKSIFASSYLAYFSTPPDKKGALPDNINKELKKITSKYKSGFASSGDSHRRWAAMYATYWWNRRNIPKYPSYPNDCANFVSQCLYEAEFSMDTFRDYRLSENPYTGFSQEWHINLYSNYQPSYSWTWVPCLDYYDLNNWDYTWCGFKGNLVSYDDLKLGDIVDLDGADGSKPNGVPDHIGIVVEFSPNGTPLVAAHSNDVFGANWKWSGILYHCISLNYAYDN